MPEAKVVTCLAQALLVMYGLYTDIQRLQVFFYISENITSHVCLCNALNCMNYHGSVNEESFIQLTHFGCLVWTVSTLLMPTSIYNS